MSRLIGVRLVVLIALATLTVGCGGGGGSSSNNAPATSSDWDSLVWDQDNWS
ncbi:hypothetical protein ACFL3A_00205 [Pseudomonadota bacterium]